MGALGKWGLWLALWAPLAAAPAVRAQTRPMDVPVGERAYQLERALEDARDELDGLSAISLVRSATTFVFESYCAVEGLFPDADGYHAPGLVAGVGCFVGAAALFWSSARRAAALGSPETSDRSALLARYRLARRTRPSEATVLTFERELERMAVSDRFRRATSLVIGAASLVTSGTVAALAAEDVVDETVGAAIAVTTAIVAAISFFAGLVDGSAETALERYRAATRP